VGKHLVFLNATTEYGRVQGPGEFWIDVLPTQNVKLLRNLSSISSLAVRVLYFKIPHC
jgi:hypothetical protein